MRPAPHDATPRDAREAALAAAYAAHAAPVTALAARLLSDADAARDVCQETFVRLHARLDEVQGDPWMQRSVSAL